MPDPGARMQWLWRTLTLLHVLTSFFSVVDPLDGNPEVKSLFAIKRALQDPLNVLASWDSNYMSPCTFAFVDCDSNNSINGLELPRNGLSGSLSPLIGSLSNLHRLNLFSCAIPNSLVNLKNLVSLNLRGNHFNGSFPAFVANMSSLQSLDVSENNLSGFVGNQTLKTLITDGNVNLCGLAIRKECPGDPPLPNPANINNIDNIRSRKSANTSAVACGLSLGVAVLLGSFMLGLLWWRRRNSKQIFFDVNEQQDPDVLLGQLKKFSFRELQIATDNFNTKNILGKGGFGNVYKGYLCDGSIVAVKRLKGEGSPGHEMQFQTEVEMISLAVHRNLLRLRGFCMTPTERLLVYPYMPNGSVASRLRDIVGGKPALDWPTRKCIALGAARGLLYLHEHCDPKIIHRDVKAANILLDEGYEAVVGDFGLAKLLDHRNSHVTTAVRGTVGHIAPEYLSTGQSSEKTDVFGYGVLLLELITGQRAFGFGRLSRQNDMMLLDWVKKLQAEKRLDLLVDVDFKSEYNSLELEEMVQVALLCTQMLPTERPKMLDVVRMLEGDGLAERWEQWCEVESRRSREALLPRRYCELVEDSSWDIEAIQLSGPR
ncbi:LRR receptor kinase BAK1 isoform X2 [Physcomitrium patens]|uniref:LRR receptor kinase BAK1 isoform X2 n=1 Tax=Physcomitrium patens TaxID=3218 RepID=UPI003CCE08E8